ncbi:hypothetical protein [Streptomyces sp. NPDC015125]|uniref:hypothetical protein n=1 Tax=Streptomyces sp. NPDC015125 TaxID=3364938 RepID=UPI0037033344
MSNTPVLICSAIATAVAYHLGASGIVPRATGRLRSRTRTVLIQWLAKPAWHPARWTVEAVAHVRTASVVVCAFALHPIASTRLMRQVVALAPRHQPDELKNAVAEAARLHVPDQPVTSVRVAIYQPHRTFGLDNVAFRHGRHPEDVTRVTLGGNPISMSGPTDPDIREQLHGSRERVAAALATLPIGPDITAISVPVDRKSRRGGHPVHKAS